MNTKDMIMDSAIKLFLKDGFANVSNAKILEKSNVGSGTIYYHFTNKDDLITSVLDKYVLEMLTKRLDIIKSYSGDSHSTLEFLYRQMIGCDSKKEPYFVLVDSEDYSFKKVILLACEGIQKYESVNRKYNEFNDALIEYIAEYINTGKEKGEIRDDLTSQELSYLIQSNLNGVFFMSIIQDNLNLNEIIESNVKNVWEFIKANEN
ncbi:MAG: TetR/AcrR family transcriptional regulator [Methanobrevibacter sp.]|nr:TetR/AcrR family transcriptional regulator [Methanobrevibacter sp.]